MATENLQIPDISASQNQKEVTANAASNLMDRALNNIATKVITVDTSFTTTEARENFVIELTGTPGAPRNINMPDTNRRTMVVFNNTDDVMTIRNSASGGTGQPVLQVGEASIFHYDGTNLLDLSALALSASTWLDLSDTPASFANLSGQMSVVNFAETALEFVKTTVKLPVVAATDAAGTLVSTFEAGDVIDGVTLVLGDRILIKDQATASENGVYTVETTGAPTRAGDFDDDADVSGGVLVPVMNHTGALANENTIWMLNDDDVVSVGSDNLNFVLLLSTGTFLSLTDAPSTYSNQSGMDVRVNEAENALEFVPTNIKIAVRVATSAAGTLATDFDNGKTVDGVTLVTDDRILIKNQVTASENGIYVVASSGAPARALDLDANDQDVILGAMISVLLGTANAETIWMHTVGTDIGTDDLTFVQTGGGGSVPRFTEATVQTTTATITTIASIALASGEATVVRGFIIGTQGSSANSFAGTFIAAGKNNGGTSAQLNAPIFQKIDGDGGNSWDFTVDVDDASDTIRIRVTGQAATTIDWRVQFETITEANI